MINLCNIFNNIFNNKFNNKFNNTLLLAGDKIMQEMHLKQTRFMSSACGLFTKNEYKD